MDAQNIVLVFAWEHNRLEGTNVWNKIEPLLKARKMSVFDLSKAAGYAQTGTVYRLKNGDIQRPSFELMERIADALNVSLDEFRSVKQND